MDSKSTTNAGWDTVETKEDVDLQFFALARDALTTANVTALEYLRVNPEVSPVELARMLGCGASAVGLIMVLYTEANREGQTRDLARELLYRDIVRSFPDGWTEDERVHPLVKLVGWADHVSRNAREHYEPAKAILNELTIGDKPRIGWMPSSSGDERLKNLFNKHWREPKSSG